MFSYKLEKEEKLIERLVDYIIEARRNGILSLDSFVNDEKNELVKRVISSAVDGKDPKNIKEETEILIEYYLNDALFFTKKKKYNVEKQMKMILHFVLLLQDGLNPRDSEQIFMNYYPTKTIPSIFNSMKNFTDDINEFVEIDIKETRN